MARSIEQIKKQMAEQFMADPVIREKYGITGSASFEEAFSRVSIESILFFVVASAIYVVEAIFDRHAADIDRKVETAVLASLPWYHKIALEYQHGDDLVWNDMTQSYGYADQDDKKKKVKYAACQDMGGGVRLLVSGASSDGRPEKLSDDVLTAFKHYLNRRKPAGVVVEAYSLAPDKIILSLAVQYNPLLLNADGSLISSPSRFPVEEAVKEYLRGIVYGGVFNKTSLIDNVQKAEGVVDVVLSEVKAVQASGEEAPVKGNNYTAGGGSFEPYKLREGISYVLSV